MSIINYENEINNNTLKSAIMYTTYKNESQLSQIKKLIENDLSEPYSIYVYRYFLENWPKYCYLAFDEAHENKIIGVVVCKIETVQRLERNMSHGYIAMLAVDTGYRNKSIGTNLVSKCVQAMICDSHVEEIILETEVTNVAALKLYEKLGFIRYKKQLMYYLNGIDAFRLKLCVNPNFL